MYPIFPGRIWLSGKLTASVLLKGLDVKLGCPTSPRAVAEFRPFSNAPAKSFRWFYLDFSKPYKTSNCLSAFRCAREDSSCCCHSDTGQGCNKQAEVQALDPAPGAPVPACCLCYIKRSSGAGSACVQTQRRAYPQHPFCSNATSELTLLTGLLKRSQ